MKNEMVNRVAEAIRSLPRIGCCETLNVEDDAEVIARAAIAAMREPTFEMLVTGIKDRSEIQPSIEVRATWASMVDAALD